MGAGRKTRSQIAARARRIQLLALDVDGVLTDRRIVLGSDGHHVKSFDVRDGFGLVLAREAGLRIAIITAEESNVVTLRARQLKIDWVAQAARDKAKAFQQLLVHFRLNPQAIGYIGDDLLDLPVLRRVGFSATVADAAPEVKRRVHYVAALPGGRGAVREIVEFILQSQGHWPRIMKRFLR